MHRNRLPNSRTRVLCLELYFFFVADLARTSWTWVLFMGFLRCEGSISGVFFRSVDSFLTIDAFVLRRRIVARTTSLNGAAFQTRRTKTDWRPTSSAKKFISFTYTMWCRKNARGFHKKQNNLQTLEIDTTQYIPPRITF